ncbi:PD-(D/E)XK nuclease family protein [bacterium]|nr:PD-(D/E)XK nuclease family protein [bacterium]
MAEEVKDKQKMLKKLEQDLEKLNIITRQFNIFKVLKSEEYEIRHSNFLAWLMRPNENHGLKDYFLKEFLKSAIKDYTNNVEIEVKLRDIIFYDFSDIRINREDNHIDILLVSYKSKFVCVIENKIDSGENGTQLSRYAEYIENNFKEYKKLFIYLSKETNNNELIPRSIKDKTVYYIPMCYEQVKDVINNVLKFKSSNLNNEVKIFIEHYKKNIERYIMNNTDEETKNIIIIKKQ